MAVVVAIDAGTTGVRSFAVSEAGLPVGMAYREFTQHFPRPGWVEHDATEIWEAVRATLTDLIASLDEPIAAIGITDQRETVVAWDRRTGEPRHRAIVWQDRRTAARCDELADAGHLPLVRGTTGLVLDPYFSGTKVEWLLRPADQGGGGVEADEHLAVGTIDTWLLWQLTGGQVHATEPSNASRTMLFDIRTLDWSDELCELFGVPRAALPEVRPSSGRFGTTAVGVGVPAGIPISGVAGDQQAALFGQACFEPGMTKNTYGTGSFVLMNVGARCPEPVEGLLTTVAWSLGCGRRGGHDLRARGRHLRHRRRHPVAARRARHHRRSGRDRPAGRVGARHRRRDAGAGVHRSRLALVGPVRARCAGGHHPGHDPRAPGAGDGRGDGLPDPRRGRGDVRRPAATTSPPCGPTAAPRSWTCCSSCRPTSCRCPVSRPTVQETTALGAAYLAGLAEGVWSSPAEVTQNWALDVEVAPQASRQEADAAHATWLRAVERSRGWATE